MTGAHILVVDDDPDLREVVTLMLEAAGYRVRQAENGQIALERIKEELPGLILLDMKMPVMDGWSFAAEFHARYAHRVPIVVITAAEDARHRAREVEAEGWIGKPFELDELGTAVLRHLTSGEGGSGRVWLG
ncbi:response regulator [Vitiosangium sp. GDMCC 1.1324]|uniref:response regulator n=1 Tax=Vitiosangium sp. (strain GDMCC 1.1324) TaxID=2138576 RepID=UPI000D3B6AB0|nr:response regulator [Vitiosangium sp. GDMCC 1.1324]PTL85681.1 response regulator [Vitiosangium sp. GDMCC 1.1324]